MLNFMVEAKKASLEEIGREVQRRLALCSDKVQGPASERVREGENEVKEQ